MTSLLSYLMKSAKVLTSFTSSVDVFMLTSTVAFYMLLVAMESAESSDLMNQYEEMYSTLFHRDHRQFLVHNIDHRHQFYCDCRWDINNWLVVLVIDEMYAASEGHSPLTAVQNNSNIKSTINLRLMLHHISDILTVFIWHVQTSPLLNIRLLQMCTINIVIHWVNSIYVASYVSEDSEAPKCDVNHPLVTYMSTMKKRFALSRLALTSTVNILTM